MPTLIAAGNWKMNTTLPEAVALARELRESLAPVDGVMRVVCPPFISLPAVAETLRGSPVQVGAQNMHPEAKGAFTGEVSGTMLAGIASHVIVGHSERRHILGEHDAFINDKVRAALRFNLTPILCVGETLAEREAGQAMAVVERQLRAGLARLEPGDFARLVVAYEPMWAIGTGRAATPEIAQDMMGAIRATLAMLSSLAASRDIPLLYGGSVTPDNIAGFAAQRDVDGALVGGASLKAPDFTKIAQEIAAARR
ncbi:MAG: triose-phosphate isomerase [SAR202 cluster bacterium]|nr:triose-phosphate isomerase [SAR202 cluster bacterium]